MILAIDDYYQHKNTFRQKICGKTNVIVNI